MKKKVLLVYNYLLHYRISVFNILAEKYDLTVVHSGELTKNDGGKYNEIIVPVNKIGPFYYQKGLRKEFSNPKYDKIIVLFDLRWISTIVNLLSNRNIEKSILWGAWITKNNLANKIRLFFANKALANVFYTPGAMLDFINIGLDEKKCHIANNTFDVNPRQKSYNYSDKYSLLFVGSIDKRKELDVLISTFSAVKNKIPNNIKLVIVGDGSEKENLQDLSVRFDLDDDCIFVGKENDATKLAEYYKHAICSVSYGQAGLSVLQSLGFGVPFVTKSNAISGGEKENIIDGVNGYLCSDNFTDLESRLIYLCNNIDAAIHMGRNAYQHYEKYCTIENMANGFIDAIEETRTVKIRVVGE